MQIYASTFRLYIYGVTIEYVRKGHTLNMYSKCQNVHGEQETTPLNFSVRNDIIYGY